MADFGAELDGFRSEVRDWLKANFPPSLAHTATSGFAGAVMRKETADDDLWRERFGETGWGVPDWPEAYGGAGLSPGQVKVLREEMARIGAANPIGGMGVMMLGPTLLEYGDEAQKKRHLPAVARGALRWCQGFSEPGAGSDLAGLQTKAEDQARAEADAARAAQESQDRLAAQNEKVAQHAQIAASGARRVQAPASAAMTAAERAQNRAAWQQRQAEAAQRRKDLAKRLQEESATPLLPLPPAPAPAASIN